jgi:glycosyltransferase involved in cell wall biosynthesis
VTGPAVSVVVSVYNAERYLREALDSVLAQSFPDFECVIVDDGSRDGSLAILRDYESRDRRVRVISRPNKGLTVSLNEAIATVRGEFIARMDADDVCLPTRFAEQVAFLRSNPGVLVVGSSVELIDPYGVPIGTVHYPTDHAEIDARLLAGEGGVLPHPATLLRTAAVRAVGGYREEFNNSEDLDLWLRLAEVGRVANLPGVLLKYRRDLNSVSHKKRDNQLRMKGRIVGQAYARRGLTPPATWDFGGTWVPKPHDVQLREWGWKALKVGRPDAARGHAKALLKEKPLSLASWRLAFCAWRGK